MIDQFDYMASDSALVRRLSDIQRRISAAARTTTGTPLLVAVSKTRPLSDVLLAANSVCKQRHFGENYVRELLDKVSNTPQNMKDELRWHMIGHLQSNKARMLVHGAGDALYMIHSVDSVKLANAIHKACQTQQTPRREKLRVLVQVNTSGEVSKSGCTPEDVIEIFKHCRTLETLNTCGLMTIGRMSDNTEVEKACFECLIDCRKRIATELGIDADTLELSMGMSGDFEKALELGSTIVRVGSAIFGARTYGGINSDNLNNVGAT